MVEGRQTMSDTTSAFEAKDEQLLGQFTELQIMTGETSATAGAFGHFENGVQSEEYHMDESVGHNLSPQGNGACHAKLLRRNSDEPKLHQRRSSLQSSSTTKLPKIPLRRRLSGDCITESGRRLRQDSFSRIDETQQIYKPGLTRGDHELDAAQIPVKRRGNSFPQENAPSFGFQRTREDHGTRRRSTPWSSATRRHQRKVGISSCSPEVSKWRMNMHKRSLKIDDDDDTLDNSMSRSSSSSGFSSQSSLLYEYN